jgi:EAL domain-containing protein (putative c-di-GMP-specific phosphodiesterase class I)
MNGPALRNSEYLDFFQTAVRGSTDDILPKALAAIREHLGMEVAFLSEISGGRRLFRYVDTELTDPPVKAGEGGPLEDSYCQRVIDGRLPELIHNAQDLREALTIPATVQLPVGAHISVPVRYADGSIYGTFCCFSSKPNYDLTERDVGMMRVFADLTAVHIANDLAELKDGEALGKKVEALLRSDEMSSVYQPIYDIRTKTVCGFECLSRFSGLPKRTPDVWFAEAASVGLGSELELKAAEQGLQALAVLPSRLYASVNVSAATIIGAELRSMLSKFPMDRVVLELTEHDTVEKYDEVIDAISWYRSRGVQLAVDDAGAGYSSFSHILHLLPTFIKLDLSLTRGVDLDPARRALARGLVGFALEIGSDIIAEGVETESELATLIGLGVGRAQGYLLGRPEPLAVAQALASP